MLLVHETYHQINLISASEHQVAIDFVPALVIEMQHLCEE